MKNCFFNNLSPASRKQGLILILAIGIVVIGAFLAEYYFFSITKDSTQQIIRTVNNEEELQELAKVLTVTERHQNAFITTHDSSYLKPFNNTITLITDSFFSDLYRVIPTYAKHVAPLHNAILEKIDLLQKAIGDSSHFVNSKSYRSQIDLVSKNIASAFIVLRDDLRQERILCTQQRDVAQKKLLITFIIAFIIVCILLWFLYRIITVKIQACSSCDKQVLITQLEAEKKIRENIDYLSTVLGEIKTPMNNIIGASLFLSKDMTNEQKQHNDKIRSNSVVLLAVMNDVLDLSKMKTGTLKVDNTPFLFKNCIDEVILLMTTNNQIHVVYDKAVPDVIDSDPSKIRQILIGLFANTMNLSDGWNISLKIGILNEKNNQLTIEFKFSATKVKNILQDNTAISNHQDFIGCMPIGLSVSARLSSLLGGVFKTESQGASGSNFVFTIKANRASGEQISGRSWKDGESYEADSALSKRIPLKILVADDNPMTQILLTSALLKMGYSCLTAKTSEECVQLAIDNEVDMIFMDQHINGMDGVRIAEKIRNYYMNSKTPIIVATTPNPFYKKEEGLIAGINDYMVKPIRPKDLERMIRKWWANGSTT